MTERSWSQARPGYRVRLPSGTTVPFFTLNGANIHASLVYERDPRTARPVVEYLDPDTGYWEPISDPLGVHRIPEPAPAAGDPAWRPPVPD